MKISTKRIPFQKNIKSNLIENFNLKRLKIILTGNLILLYELIFLIHKISLYILNLYDIFYHKIRIFFCNLHTCVLFPKFKQIQVKHRLMPVCIKIYPIKQNS